MKHWQILFTISVLMQYTEAYPNVKKCHYATYRIQGTYRCETCEVKCSPTQGMVKNCGYDNNGQRIREPCKRCPDGKYSGMMKNLGNSITRVCLDCTQCENLKRRYILKCTRRSNSKCGECFSGFYSGENTRMCYAKIIMTSTGLKTKLPTTKMTIKSIKTTSHHYKQTATNLRTLHSTNIRTKPLSKASKRHYITHTLSSFPKTYKKNITRKFTTPLVKISMQSKLVNKTENHAPRSVNTTEMTSLASKQFSKQSLPTRHEQNVTARAMHTTRVAMGSNYEYITSKKDARENNLSGSPSKDIFHATIWFTVIIVLAFIVFGFLIATTCKWRKKWKNRETSSFDNNPRASSEASSINRLSVLKATLSTVDSSEDNISSSLYLEDHVIEVATKDLVNNAKPFDPDAEEDDDGPMVLKSAIFASVPLPNVATHPQKTEEFEREALMLKESTIDAKRKKYQRHHSVESEICTSPHSCCKYSRTRSCSKKIESLKICQRKLLQSYLDVETSGVANWKEIATYFGVYERLINQWDAKYRAGFSPTETVLRFLSASQKSVADFIKCLEDLTRLDVKDSLLTHLEEGCNVCC